MNDTSPTSNPKSLRDLLRTIELVHTACDGDYQFASKRTLELLEPFSALIHDLPVETSRDDARDAARYRYLRERLACDRLAARKLVITTEGGREPYRTLREAELDREIDECIGLSVEPTAELSDGDHELYVVSPEDRLREIVRSIDPPPPLPTLDELRNDTEFEPLSPDKTTQDSGA